MSFFWNYISVFYSPDLLANFPKRLRESPKMGHKILFAPEDSLYRNIFPQ
jgi:hypothetical protein